MTHGEPNPPVTPKSILNTLKEWKELVGFIALTLASALGGVLGNRIGSDGVQILCWALATVFVAIGAYVVHRKQRLRLEQERREKRLAERETSGKPQTAFRSLAPFEERDELPGKDRRLEARTIATRIASDDFKFGIVCGDTGCGKTSLLRTEVTRSLQKLGFEVSYIRSPRQLEVRASDGPAPERLVRELRALARNYIHPTTRVLILDQFEEWFIEYQDPELRRQIGRSLTKFAERVQPVKVVCAIRRDFLVDLHDVSDELAQPLSNANIFHVKNFTMDQAVNVISECATAEGLGLDESFALAIVHDLTEANQVRPPELQIVCTYLASSGTLNTQKYRQAGGTAGILAHYIQQALDASKDRALAARLLRALCDFPAHAKRKPRSIDDISADVSDTDFRSKSVVEVIANQFVNNRILLREEKDRTYALMHDYLVDAIQLATADASTKTEEANQLLRYYVKEERGTIPYRKVRFIKAFADRASQNQPAARELIRRSTFMPFLRWGTPLVVIMAVLGFYIFSTSHLHWEAVQILGQHSEHGDTDDVQVERVERHRLIFTRSDKYGIIWNAMTGKNEMRLENKSFVQFSRSGHFLVISDSDFWPGSTKLMNRSSGAELVIPQSSQCRFSDSEEWLTCEVRNEESPRNSKRVVISTKDMMQRSVALVPKFRDLRFSEATQEFF